MTDGDRSYQNNTGSLDSPARDPYEVLGVPRTASQADIKKAYYVLAKQYHPDTTKDKQAREKFVQIQAAYEQLCNQPGRRRPDPGRPGFGSKPRTSEESYGAGRHGRPSWFDPNDFFGGGFERTVRPATGEDIQAARGTSKTVTVDRVSACVHCHGSGLRPGKDRVTCSACGGCGTRTAKMNERRPRSHCSTCGGAGFVSPPEATCPACAGTGLLRETRSVAVTIPAGVGNHARIRVPHQGNAPHSGKGKSGDLFISIHIEPSKEFRRQDADIFVDKTIPFYKAILGGTIRVLTIQGEVEMCVPPGSQVGDQLSLKGYGIPRLRGTTKGDQIVRLLVELPSDDTLTKEQRALIEKYAALVESTNADA